MNKEAVKRMRELRKEKSDLYKKMGQVGSGSDADE